MTIFDKFDRNRIFCVFFSILFAIKMSNIFEVEKILKRRVRSNVRNVSNDRNDRNDVKKV